MTNAINKIRIFLKDYKWTLFIATFLLHESFVILLNYGVLNISVNLGDQLTYHNFASQISDLISNGSYIYGAIYSYHWYPLFVGVLYFIFGKLMIFGVSVNALLIAFSSVLLFNIISIFNSTVNKRIIFWVVFFTMNCYASLMFNSSLLFKEAWIVFLMLGILYLSIKIINKNNFNWFYLILILFLFLLLRSLRFFIAYAPIAGFLVAWFWNSNHLLKKRIIYGVIMVLIFGIISLNLINCKIIKNFTGPSILETIQPEFIYNTRIDYFKNGVSTTNIKVVEQNDNNYKFSLKGIVESSFNIFLGPFPWQMPLKKYILIIFDLMSWYPILILGLIGIIKSRLKSTLLYLIPTIVITFCLIMGVDNLGALIRYRMPVLILLSIFVPTGVSFLIDYFLKNIKNENTLHNN